MEEKWILSTDTYVVVKDTFQFSWGEKTASQFTTQQSNKNLADKISPTTLLLNTNLYAFCLFICRL